MVRTKATLQNHETTLKSQSASLKNLEVQVNQIANMLNYRQLGTLPSNTEVNLREHVNAIMLRSGKEFNEPKAKQKIKENAVEEEQSNKV